jgi:hypothetical protein
MRADFKACKLCVSLYGGAPGRAGTDVADAERQGG